MIHRSADSAAEKREANGVVENALGFCLSIVGACCAIFNASECDRLPYNWVSWDDMAPVALTCKGLVCLLDFIRMYGSRSRI